MHFSPLTYRRTLALAWPIVLAQAATAMTGVVDTAVMGRFGDKVDLAGVAVAAVSFSFIYWGFGFLRMATTGLTAQAEGANDTPQSRAILIRALLLGGALGIGLFTLAPLLKWVAFTAFQAETGVERLARDYFNARIWGAPALLMSFGISGWLIGMGRTRTLLAFQIIVNSVNIVLDMWFVARLDWGPAGIGAGTALAEWAGLAFGLLVVRDAFTGFARLWDGTRLRALFLANRDIMIRTLALLFSFAWFVNAGTRVGTAALAGNEVLLQFIAVAAFILDAFAFVAEKEAGEAAGAGDPARLTHAMRVTSTLALGFGALIALIFWIGGQSVITLFIQDPDVAATARTYLPFCAMVPFIGVPAWQLDGLFIGATEGKALRNAGLLSTLLYVAVDLMLQPFGNLGVWSAFLSLYLWRAVCLGAYWPRLQRRLRG